MQLARKPKRMIRIVGQWRVTETVLHAVCSGAATFCQLHIRVAARLQVEALLRVKCSFSQGLCSFGFPTCSHCTSSLFTPPLLVSQGSQQGLAAVIGSAIRSSLCLHRACASVVHLLGSLSPSNLKLHYLYLSPGISHDKRKVWVSPQADTDMLPIQLHRWRKEAQAFTKQTHVSRSYTHQEVEEPKLKWQNKPWLCEPTTPLRWWKQSLPCPHPTQIHAVPLFFHENIFIYLKKSCILILMSSCCFSLSPWRSLFQGASNKAQHGPTWQNPADCQALLISKICLLLGHLKSSRVQQRCLQ